MQRSIFVLSLALASACGGDKPTSRDSGVSGDGSADGGINEDGGGRPDFGFSDIGPRDTGEMNTACNNPPLTPPASGTCTVTEGSGLNTLIRGNLLGPEGLIENGHLLIGADGKIICAACDCSAAPEFARATIIECANGVVSPGLINTHEHITFTETPPATENDDGDRYDHRHEWRRGLNGKQRIPSVSNMGGSSGISWGELRHLMGGATSINGSGAADGLTRNLDRTGDQQGLGIPAVRYQTFPLGDSDGTLRSNNCSYPSLDSPTDNAIVSSIAYTPHIAEGIDDNARNEFLCLSGAAPESTDVILGKTAIIHAIGLVPADLAKMAAAGASLIWSPRSNIDLYGHTAQVVLASQMGVRVALGTDWTATGSINLLRELRCAEELNDRNFGGFFTDRDLVAMVTSNAAASMGSGDRLGLLRAGYEADVVIWNGATNLGYRAVLDAQPQDVVLVLRSGLVQYGDQALVTVLPSGSDCEALDVCGTNKAACVERETGMTIAQHRAAVPNNTYDLFFCGDPPGEPTCVPYRVGEFTGMSSADDLDGDGVPNSADLCPSVFDAPRPLDDGTQADADDDGVGDACDPCPLQVGISGCAPPDPNDLDGDGVPLTRDNCPQISNADQADGDMDGIGDVCDACPDEPNPAGAACTATVYEVKQGTTMGRVRLRDLTVTAVAPNGYYAQAVPGSMGYDMTLGVRFSAVFVFTSAAGMKPPVGARVDLDGDVSEFFGQTQIGNGTFTITATSSALPDPVQVSPAEVTTGGPRASELEAALIEVRSVEVTNIMPPLGAGDRDPSNEFVVDGTLRVNDQIYLISPFPAVGERIGFLRGVLRYANDNSKLEPRGEADVGRPPRLVRINPATAFVPLNTNGVPPGGLAVEMSAAVPADTTITLSVMGAGLTVPATVIVPRGAQRANIPVNATASGTVRILASYDGVTQTADLTVYGDQDPRNISAISANPARIRPSETSSITVRLEIPAATNGTSLTVTAPSNLVMAPATVIVPAGQLEVSFGVTARTSTGTASITVATADDAASLNLPIVRSVTRRPGPGDLVITEVHRNPSAASEQTFEWFEVANVSSDELLVNGLTFTDNAGSATLMIADPIQPGQHVLIGHTADPTRNGGVTLLAAYGGNIQLGNNGDMIRLSDGAMTIDIVTWAMGWPGAMNGIAMCLKTASYTAAGNDMSASWGNSVGTFGTGDRGHPGIPSDATNCP